MQAFIQGKETTRWHREDTKTLKAQLNTSTKPLLIKAVTAPSCGHIYALQRPKKLAAVEQSAGLSKRWRLLGNED